MNFHKLQALGNDFVVVRECDLPGGVFDEDLFRRLCDRHFGAGADGVEVLLDATRPEGADFGVRLFNADGGETPISGNGTRCVAAWLYLVGNWQGDVVRIATGAGIRTLRPLMRRPDRLVFETSMGRPHLLPAEIPVIMPSSVDEVIDQPLEVDGHHLRFTSVSMGNPHCSIFVNSFDHPDWRRLGAMIETHPRFPERTNVEFVRVIDRRTIEVRFWERGCGETLASGTGACGAALAAIRNRLTERRLDVRTVAGQLIVEWRDDGTVWQTGEACLVYAGEWRASAPDQG